MTPAEAYDKVMSLARWGTKPKSVPQTQDASKGMLALADLLRTQEPDIFDFIMGLDGNPRIHSLSIGYDDNITFMVETGFGMKANDKIQSLCSNQGYVEVAFEDGADIVTWWA